MSVQKNNRKPFNDPGYPPYPSDEDIYKKEKESEDINPADPSQDKKENDTDTGDAKDKEGNMGSNLDVPGSDLDDADENIGEEDEENNYYSLGGDKDPEDNRDFTP